MATLLCPNCIMVEVVRTELVLIISHFMHTVIGNFTIQPQTLQVPISQIAAFECESSNSFPEPSISWLKDGIPVAVDNVSVIVSPLQTLFIREFDPATHTGSYQCVITNIAGTRISKAAVLSAADTSSGCKLRCVFH